MSDRFDLTGQVAFVTGASSGLGAHFAQTLAGAGAQVVIAARRTDVIGVTTLAANLDHQFWTQQGGMTPLYGSLNPAHVANEISHIPQIHFIGEDDETVPNSVAYAYMSDIKDTSRIRIVKLPDMDHTCCWVEPWKNLLRNYVNR